MFFINSVSESINSVSIRFRNLSIRYQFGFGIYQFGINSVSEIINSVKCSESFRKSDHRQLSIGDFSETFSKLPIESLIIDNNPRRFLACCTRNEPDSDARIERH